MSDPTEAATDLTRLAQASVPKRERPRVAGPELDALEHAWWNDHAELLARFWEMDERFSTLLRRHYLMDAKAFFLEGRERATVLELGCGSGWVGRAIAGPRLRIVGTDFSESQLDLARTAAAKAGLEPFVEYRLGASDAWPEEIGACDGVLIHSFLHHLDGAELDAFLDGLAARLRPGARVFLFEPAYLGAASRGEKGPKPWRSTKHLQRLAERLRAQIDRALPRETRDADADAAFRALMAEADRRGWYLSPKEVPFEQEAFTTALAQRFALRGAYWAVLHTIGWAYERNLRRPAPPREHLFWPLLVRIDRRLARDPGYVHRTLIKPAHAFHVWRCEK